MELGHDIRAPRGEAITGGSTPTPPLLGHSGRLTSDPQQLRVDAVVGFVDEKVEEAVAHHHLLPQWDGTMLVHDDLRRSTHGPQPLSELLGIAHRGRECGEEDALGQVDDHLLPHWPSESIREVVHLVHDDESQLI